MEHHMKRQGSIWEEARRHRKTDEPSGNTNIEHLCQLKITSDCANWRKTSIICTIGPSCDTVEKLCDMIDSGMNIARLNFSHGSHEAHAKTIATIREAAKQMDAVIAIALDTKGPEIRTGLLLEARDCEDKNKEIELIGGHSIMLSTEDSVAQSGTATCVYVDYKNLPKVVEEGSRIYIDDGLLSLVVDEIHEHSVSCTVENGGLLGSRKGVNLPGTRVDLPPVTEKDMADLIFGVEQHVDMIFASFIRDASGIQEIRTIMGEKGQGIQIIAKIESEEGVLNADSIISESDGVMVARGDLGIEIPPEKVFLAQKMLVAKCNLHGKPVICATQMLESMVSKPRPTRAECSDVANAVLDGVDCVMLSGETAKGQYPVEALEMMHSVCCEAEAAFYYQKYLEEILLNTIRPTNMTNTTTIAAVNAVLSCRATAIILLTNSGSTAKMCSRYRPPVPIISVCRDERIARQLHLYRSVYPMVYKKEKADDWEQDVENRIEFGIQAGRNRNFIRTGDFLVVITGWNTGSGYTNTLRMITAS